MQIPAQIQRWIEIDLDALAANCLEIRRHLAENVRLMAVVKANGYGMGAVACARVFEQYAEMLAVTTIEEGIELRLADIKAPILVLAPAAAGEIASYVQFSLTPSIDDIEALQALNDMQNAAYPIHIELDTGMNRTGVKSDDALALLQAAAEMPHIKVEGVFSHLAAAAAADKTSAKAQQKCFEDFLAAAKAKGIAYGMAHLANSAAVLALPEAQFDMVRVGTLLYGQSPCALPADWKLANPWSVKARVLAIHDVKAGETVGYGNDFKAKKAFCAAVVAIGYVDGLTMEPHARSVNFTSACKEFTNSIARLLLKKPKYYALYQGKKLAIVGRVSMQLTVLDISGTDIEVGSVVELPMRRMSANALLARAYKANGEICELRSTAIPQAAFE